MPLRCLTAGRMTMTATILHQDYDAASGAVVGDINIDDYGQWVENQDPLTNEIVRVWVPTVDVFPGPDNTPGTVDDVTVTRNVPCIARGIVDGGIRVAGTTERFGEEYQNIDFVKLWVPPNVIISKRDRVTNIADPTGRIIWVDEEFTDPRASAQPRATVYNVNGVTPLLDAFNRLSEWYVMLERVESNVGQL